MVRGRQAGVVRDFQSTPTVQQKPGTMGGADSVRTASSCHGGTQGGTWGHPRGAEQDERGARGGELRRMRDEEQSWHEVNRDKKGVWNGKGKRK